MENQIIIPNTNVLNKKNKFSDQITPESKFNSLWKLIVVALIFIPSFLGIFSPGKHWGGDIYAQIPNAVFDANDAHKGILIPRVSLLSATDIITVPSPSLS
jgi:hypothetical protein